MIKERRKEQKEVLGREAYKHWYEEKKKNVWVPQQIEARKQKGWELCLTVHYQI